jgi:signal transduction histidine kinase
MLAAGNRALRSARRSVRRSARRPRSAGPAMATATGVAARTAATIRCLVLAYVLAQVIIWRSFYAADPWRLTGPAVAVAGGAAVLACLRQGAPGGALAAADSAVVVALALAAVWCVPPPMRGDTANWLYISMAGQLLMPAWFAPTAAFVPLALASGAAYWAGAVASPVPGSAMPGSADNSPAAASLFLLTIGVVAWYGLRMVYRRAATADAALAQADRQSRQQYVTLLRDIEGREHDRLLHDTVLNTLTALGRPAGGTREVAARVRLDVTLMESALSETGDLTAGAGGPAAAAGPDGGLLAAITAAVTTMCGRGLDVHLDIARRVADWAAAPPAASAPLGASARPLVMPGRVATALAQAAGEALANVARHAGTGEAWVVVRPIAAGPAEADRSAADPAEAGLAGIRVTVRDAGAGFDPAQIGPDRLGVRRSIVERVGDWGGQATVRSAPGGGTEVSLAWTASPGEPSW